MKPTDIVYLLSGSVPMTVKKVVNNEARCVWFFNGDSKEAVFPVELLTTENPCWKILDGGKTE